MIKSNRSPAFIFIALALTGSSMLFSADSKTTLNSADAKFVTEAAMNGKAIVQVSELGVKKASTPEIKTIAEQMVKDHSAVNAELAALAKSKDLDLTSAGDPKADKAIEDLEKESGPEFDKAYLSYLEKGHKHCVEAYEEASKDAKDPELKTWIDTTLPALKGHLEGIVKKVAVN